MGAADRIAGSKPESRPAARPPCLGTPPPCAVYRGTGQDGPRLRPALAPHRGTGQDGPALRLRPGDGRAERPETEVAPGGRRRLLHEEGESHAARHGKELHRLKGLAPPAED